MPISTTLDMARAAAPPEIQPVTPTVGAVISGVDLHVKLPDFPMRWRVNDVALWDNRATQHYAAPDHDTPRVMQKVALAGDRPHDPR